MQGSVLLFGLGLGVVIRLEEGLGLVLGMVLGILGVAVLNVAVLNVAVLIGHYPNPKIDPWGTPYLIRMDKTKYRI